MWSARDFEEDDPLTKCVGGIIVIAGLGLAAAVVAFWLYGCSFLQSHKPQQIIEGSGAPPRWAIMMLNAVAVPVPETAETGAPGKSCSRGWAIVSVTGIPKMTDANKDDYNKQLLFCLQDDAGNVFAGIYHRYLQPAWPNGPWAASWRIEAGAEGCVSEWNIWNADPLPADYYARAVDWGIVWEGHHVWAAILTPDHQALWGDVEDIGTTAFLALDQVGEDAFCSTWGWASPARATLVGSDCSARREPKACSTPTPTPKPGPPGGYVTGRAVIHVTGSAAAPDAAHDKGIIAALIGSDGRWFAIRHRSREGRPGGWYQVKGTSGNEAPDDCWRERNYWQTLPASDGDWVIEWDTERASVTDPAGGKQSLDFGYRNSYVDLQLGNCPQCRGGVPFVGMARLVSWEPGRAGSAEVCP